jgi:hypothetical protein
MTTETPVTVLPMTAAAKRATSPVKISKATKATTKAMRAATTTEEKLASGALKRVTVAKRDTFTSVDLAAEKGINAKTLRARIRRNIAKWEPLFAGEKSHVQGQRDDPQGD